MKCDLDLDLDLIVKGHFVTSLRLWLTLSICVIYEYGEKKSFVQWLLVILCFDVDADCGYEQAISLA